jgi:transcriptional regulator with PAS, ATPase and Fis domain
MARKRSNINALSRLLGECPFPIYAVDQQRRISYCNAACTQWLGVDPGELMGRICNYVAISDVSSDAISSRSDQLCPPPEAFLGQLVSAEIAGNVNSTPQPPRWARFIPLGTPGEEISGVLAFVDGRDPAAANLHNLGDHSAMPSRDELRRLLKRVVGSYGLDQLIGQHPAIARARELVRLAADSTCRTIVVGPPGSGREHIARTMHDASAEGTAAPLAPLACSLLDAELLEETVSTFMASCAELEIEQPAALLLLEIDQLSPEAQRALAGILSIGELDFRTFATARQSLIKMAESGEFREDLAFALSTLEVIVPPLSERRDDIPLLAQYFLERQNADGKKQLAGLSDEALDLLQIYDWPGNVEQLSQLISEACRNSSGPTIEVADLPATLELARRAASRGSTPTETIDLDMFLASVEAELLQRALRQSKGNKAQAARLLGISRARLIRRVEFFDLEAKDENRQSSAR